MTIAIPNDIWLKKPSIGDEIVILDQVGLIVGNDIYREEGTVITIWGDDLTTDIKDGLYDFKCLRNERIRIINRYNRYKSEDWPIP